MARFDNILKTKPGDTTTPASINMGGFVPFSGRSGHLDQPGPYKFRVASASWQPKKDRPKERNLVLGFTSTAPAGCEGVPITRYQPAPDDGDPKQVGENMFKQLVWAIAANDGKLDALAKNADLKIAPKWFVGREFCATVRDGSGAGDGTSEIDRYITPDEFAATVGKAKPHSAGPRQTEVPDIGGGNGTGSSGTGSAVDAMLGLDGSSGEAPSGAEDAPY